MNASSGNWHTVIDLPNDRSSSLSEPGQKRCDTARAKRSFFRTVGPVQVGITGVAMGTWSMWRGGMRRNAGAGGRCKTKTGVRLIRV